jgi:hypothetical protein
MKYELLIKDILKHTKRAGLTDEAKELEQALNIMKVSDTAPPCHGVKFNKLIVFIFFLSVIRLYRKLQMT